MNLLILGHSQQLLIDADHFDQKLIFFAEPFALFVNDHPTCKGHFFDIIWIVVPVLGNGVGQIIMSVLEKHYVLKLGMLLRLLLEPQVVF